MPHVSNLPSLDVLIHRLLVLALLVGRPLLGTFLDFSLREHDLAIVNKNMLDSTCISWNLPVGTFEQSILFWPLKHERRKVLASVQHLVRAPLSA